MEESRLNKLPFDLFFKLIKDGKIRGKDLFNLCKSNPLVDLKCNHRKQTIFYYLLEKEFKITNKYPHWSKNHTVREQYKYLTKYTRNLKFDDNELKLWVNNLPLLVEIFEENYPKGSTPDWVDYKMFRTVKLSEMLLELINTISFADSDIEVHFGDILAITLCSDSVDGVWEEARDSIPGIPIENFIISKQ